MLNSGWHLKSLVAAVGLIAALGVGPGTAAEPDSLVVDLAIVPFANNTGQSEAHELLMPRLEGLLTGRGLNIVTSGELRPLLREYRVRSRGWISRRGVALIGDQTGAEQLLLGSWDILRTEGNIEIGVSLRLLDRASLKLVRAVSLGHTGEDRVGWLDQGRLGDVAELAGIVLAEAVAELFPGTPPAPPVAGCRRLAVVPLDNYAGTEHAGDVVTNVLLSRLLAAGYDVVEPGFVRELELTREVVNRGGVDRASAAAILAELGACQVITGAVQQFDPARGLATSSVPLFAAGLRSSDTRTGALLVSREVAGSGGDHDGFFQLGRVHAITPVVAAQLNRFVGSLPAANRKDSSHEAPNR